MKKRMVCISLTAAMLLSQSGVFADVEDVKLVGDNCVVSGTANAGDAIGVLITNGGAAGGDIDKAVNFSSVYADKSGEFSIPFAISDDRMGESRNITVFVKIGANDKKEFNLDYISPKDLADLIDLLKNTKSAAEMQAVLDNSENELGLKALGIDLILWNSCDKENASAVFYNNKACLDKTYADIEKEFQLAALLSSYKSAGKTAEEITDLIDKISVVGYADILWSDIKKNSEKSKKVLAYLEQNAPFTSTDELNSEFGAGAAFFDLKNAGTYGNVVTVFDNQNYMKLLEAEKQAYYDYFTKNKVNTAKELLKLLDKNEITSKEKFHELMNTAVENAKSAQSSDNGNTSTGGNKNNGGGGGGGGKTTSPIIAPIVKNDEENTPSGNENINKAQSFTDISDEHWAFEAVEALHEKKIINGYEDGSFLPDKKVSREEFLTMLINALDIATIGGTCPFKDVEYGKWYSPYVTTAYLKGMISGLERDKFGLGTEITRQDIASILMRSRSEYPTENIREYTGFIDNSEISEYALEAVKTMYEQKVINGADGYFNPKSPASRAETAMMIYNFINLE